MKWKTIFNLMRMNNSVEPLVLTNEDQTKNDFKRLIVFLVWWILGIILFLCLGWTTKAMIVYCLLFLSVIWSFVVYRKKKQAIIERVEYLRIDENGVKVNSDGVQTLIKWKNVVSITFYSWRNHVNFYHISIEFKEDGEKMVIRMDLKDYNEIVSHRKWKKAIIHFSGREDIVGNKHTWLVFAKEDNDK